MAKPIRDREPMGQFIPAVVLLQATLSMRGRLPYVPLESPFLSGILPEHPT